MKKSVPLIILMGTVAFYANLAFAQTTGEIKKDDKVAEQKPADQKVADQKSEDKKDDGDENKDDKVAAAKPEDDSKLSAIQKEMKAEQSKVSAVAKDGVKKDAGTIASVSSPVSKDELSNYKISFKFDGTAIVAFQQDGAPALSQICISHLAPLAVTKIKASADSSQAIQSEDDLKALSDTYKPSLSFVGDGNIKSLDDCAKQTKDGYAAGDMSKVKKEVLDNEKDWAFISMGGDSKSSDNDKDSGFFSVGYLNLKSKHIAKKDCATCNKDAASLDARIKDLIGMKSPAVLDLLGKDEEAKLAILDDRAKNVKSQDEAEKVKADLLAEADRINSSSLSLEMKQGLINSNVHGSLTETLMNRLDDIGHDAKDRKGNPDEKKQTALTIYEGTLFSAGQKLPLVDSDNIDNDKDGVKARTPGTKGKPNPEFLEHEMKMNSNHSDIKAAQQDMKATETRLGKAYVKVCAASPGSTQCLSSTQALLTYQKQELALNAELQGAVEKQQLSDMMDTTDIFGAGIGTLATQGQTMLDKNGNIIAAPAAQQQNQYLASGLAPNLPVTKYVDYNAGQQLFSQLQANQPAVPRVIQVGGGKDGKSASTTYYVVPVTQPYPSQS